MAGSRPVVSRIVANADDAEDECVGCSDESSVALAKQILVDNQHLSRQTRSPVGPRPVANQIVAAVGGVEDERAGCVAELGGHA